MDQDECDGCRDLRRRVEGLELPTWYLICRLFFWFALPIVVSAISHLDDVKIQVQARHPEWTIAQTRAEAMKEDFGDWDAFSIFTYRPFADKPETK